MISVAQLGRVDYPLALRLQQSLVDLRKASRIPDVLLLLEHPPIITLGRNAKRQNITASPELLAREGVEVFECDRGGDVTYHGPGQLVGYPIFDLRAQTGSQGERRSLGAVDYVRRLEEVLIRTCADFGVATERVPKMTGVWTLPTTPVIPSERERVEGPAFAFSHSSENRARVGHRQAEDSHLSAQHRGAKVGHPQESGGQAKIAAIGVHISRGVTSHGFALNVSPDLGHFNLIIPCGIATKPVSSLLEQTGIALTLEEVAPVVARNFGRVFNTQILWVDTLDALLGRSVGVPMQVPAELRKLHGEDSYLA